MVENKIQHIAERVAHIHSFVRSFVDSFGRVGSGLVRSGEATTLHFIFVIPIWITHLHRHARFTALSVCCVLCVCVTAENSFTNKYKFSRCFQESVRWFSHIYKYPRNWTLWPQYTAAIHAPMRHGIRKEPRTVQQTLTGTRWKWNVKR